MERMNKTSAIKTIISATFDQPVVFTTGHACRIAKHFADRPGHFYMTGSMGLSASIATGIALSTGKTAVAVDGDGSLLMNPACLITAGAIPDLPLVHVVLDDSAYASTGGQAAPSAGTDFADWARASGYPAASRATDGDELTELLRSAIARSSPTLIHCTLNAQDDEVPPRIDLDLARHGRRVSRHIRARSRPE
ncbi:hypothetical protein CCS38_22155 [Streptomyces purpurogeneiscleroticus]|nr:hypothetical protein [Streptomyces purpurogeneiscleroticus]